MPRLWRLMAGFSKLRKLQSGEPLDKPATSIQEVAANLGGAAREVPFDRLPLKIQAFVAANRKARPD